MYLIKNQNPSFKTKPNLDKKYLSLLKKYEPKCLSTRHIFLASSPKISTEEHNIVNKPKKPKKSEKIIDSTSKPSTILPPLEHHSNNFSKHKIKVKEYSKSNMSPIKNPLLSLPDVPVKSTITGNRIITLQRLSGSPIMKSYEQLIRTCSAIIPTKNFVFKKEKKRIITLKKNIKNITEDPEDNIE